MDGFTSIYQRLCNLPCCSRRKEEESSHHEKAEQQNAQKRIMEKEYPVSDPAEARLKYEINMLLLYRLYNHKRFHKLISEDMNEKTRHSLTRLIVFKCTLPGQWEKQRASRDLFRVGKEDYLTELATYWRSLPTKDEMMRYKDIWEHVAQRPLAWEDLVD